MRTNISPIWNSMTVHNKSRNVNMCQYKFNVDFVQLLSVVGIDDCTAINKAFLFI